jgi:uncharacterized OB-fold protein
MESPAHDAPFAGDGPDKQYRDFLKAGRFMLQRCRATGAAFFYPRALVPGAASTDWEWVAASGDGEVYATTTVRQRPEAGGDYNVALIDLAEGCRMMSRVENAAPGDVRIGMRVRARIGRIGDEPVVLFDPA